MSVKEVSSFDSPETSPVVKLLTQESLNPTVVSLVQRFDHDVEEAEKNGNDYTVSSSWRWDAYDGRCTDTVIRDHGGQIIAHRQVYDALQEKNMFGNPALRERIVFQRVINGTEYAVGVEIRGEAGKDRRYNTREGNHWNIGRHEGDPSLPVDLQRISKVLGLIPDAIES